jgi:hypothetical protein
LSIAILSVLTFARSGAAAAGVTTASAFPVHGASDAYHGIIRTTSSEDAEACHHQLPGHGQLISGVSAALFSACWYKCIALSYIRMHAVNILRLCTPLVNENTISHVHAAIVHS